MNSSVGYLDYILTIGLIGKDLEEVGRELGICLEELRTTKASITTVSRSRLELGNHPNMRRVPPLRQAVRYLHGVQFLLRN